MEFILFILFIIIASSCTYFILRHFDISKKPIKNRILLNICLIFTAIALGSTATNSISAVVSGAAYGAISMLIYYLFEDNSDK